jgi:4-amino-4-deoxy-L-arabinose transferase-like glycosyltransferase
MQFLLAAGHFLVLILAFEGLGKLIARGRSVSERLAAGALALALLVAAAGWLGLLNGPVLWVLLIVPAILAFRRPLPSLPRAGWLLVISFALLFPLAAMPPMARDALNHHLYLPRLWLENGGILRPGFASYFSYPYLVELFYCMSGATFGFGTSSVVSLAGFLMALLAAWETAEEWRKGTGLLAALVLLSIPEALRNATWAYSDSFLVLFSILAWRELIRQEGSAARASLWAASAAACKYNGLIVLFLVALALPLRFRPRASVLAASIAIMAGISMTWALPNIVEHGNPLYPLLGGVFGTSRDLAPEARQLLSDYGGFVAAVGGPLDLLVLPLRLAVGGEWDDPRRFDGSAGPLILLGTALFLLAGPRRKTLVLPLLCILFGVLASWPAVRVRYILPGLAMLCIPAAGGLQEALSGRRFPGMAVAVAGAVCIGWTASSLLRLYVAERPWEAGRSGFLESRLPFMRFYEMSDTVLETGDTTLFLNMGNQAFYYPGYVIYEESLFPLPLLDRIWRGMDADSIALELRESGVGYVAMDMAISDANLPGLLDAEGFAVWRDFAARKLEPVVSDGPYVLFRLAEEKAASIRLRSSPSSVTFSKSTGMEARASI